jgi:polar amino acid transport system ATP-binding protein
MDSAERDGVPGGVGCADETQGREDANGQMGSSEEILRIEGLDKSFGTLEALKSIDLKVAKGEVVFIIGPSGSGKSTLLRCINRLEEPTRGQITVGGTVITGPGVNLNRIRQDIGFVFQAFNLYPHMTAMGNVTLALRRVLKMSRTAARERGQAVLDDVGRSKLKRLRKQLKKKEE